MVSDLIPVETLAVSELTDRYRLRAIERLGISDVNTIICHSDDLVKVADRYRQYASQGACSTSGYWPVGVYLFRSVGQAVGADIRNYVRAICFYWDMTRT